MNPNSMMGSVISTNHLQRIHSMVEKRGSGTVLVGGEPLKGYSSLDGFDFSRGSFYPPTVIEDVSLEDGLWKEEVFGPVVVLKKFEVRSDLSSRRVLTVLHNIYRPRARACSLRTTRDIGSALVYGLKTCHALIE
jgi:hypothetical protein